MSWRLEASGTRGANLVVIQPIESEEPGDKVTHVRIRVTPTGGHEYPTMPVWPRGMVYRSRMGLEFTILNGVVEERGGGDGESSIWTYDYLALYGAHDLSGLQA
ncbi:hypothetical protein ACFW2V_12715 [Streptomyces sp. NPDC058947]|uniref:hypothetical protein n=1 Tax=Streptomyces sp. NPDC058947 TaxID=3346675 RepID=UPI0036CF27C0